ncbi:MAG: peptide deformylase [Candidatus Sericytochromatia bacterium]|nr:peptide deformylase [Candidatus Sericytochromatia bacterium]
MAILPIAKLGEPILRRLADPVGPDELMATGTQALIDDMIETMRSANGLGLAAPQVFVSKQIAVLQLAPSARYPDAPVSGLLTVINPVFSDQSSEMIQGWEGCLSLENLRGLVPRHAALTLDALDRQGQPLHLAVTGFLAVVLQHELDHLWGKLFIDRMADLSTLSHQREYDRHWSPLWQRAGGAPV